MAIKENRARIARGHDVFFGKGGDKAKEMPAPCFYFLVCGNLEELDKCGRGVCRPCSDGLNGMEYPLRDPHSLLITQAGNPRSTAACMVR